MPCTSGFVRGRDIESAGTAAAPSKRMKRLASLIVKGIAVIMLLVGALTHHDHGYYSLLRWVVCAVLVFAAVDAGGDEEILGSTHCCRRYLQSADSISPRLR